MFGAGVPKVVTDWFGCLDFLFLILRFVRDTQVSIATKRIGSDIEDSEIIEFRRRFWAARRAAFILCGSLANRQHMRASIVNSV